MTEISDVLKFKAVNLFGKSQSTYKMALAHQLIGYAIDNREKVPMDDVSFRFFQFYLPHVRPQEGKPLTRQLKMPRKVSSIEKAVLGFDAGKYTESQVIQYVKDNCLLAPHVVLPRYNTIGTKKIPSPFYRYDKNYLYLNDNILGIFASEENHHLGELVTSRFDLQQEVFSRAEFSDYMTYDEKIRWIRNGSNRTNVTQFRDALSGYQDDKCFLCGDSYLDDIQKTHVDHLIPRDIRQKDELWNLEVAHDFCNQNKSDDMPHRRYIEKIIKRNEAVMASEHPLRQKLELEAGKTPQERRLRVVTAYQNATTKWNRPIYNTPDRNNSDTTTEYTRIREWYGSL
mgnify:FL=1|tara:strand:- start:77 stop:1102 length:1026 start_codon:yes stop_codon:yes gene_type:complete